MHVCLAAMPSDVKPVLLALTGGLSSQVQAHLVPHRYYSCRCEGVKMHPLGACDVDVGTASLEAVVSGSNLRLIS